MLAKTKSCGLSGIEAYPIEIEVDINQGLPQTAIVGMADTCVKESKERIKSAIKNSGFKWPEGRVTVNLAPSDIKKEGTSFDLAIALGILAATAQINSQKIDQYCILGELSLGGKLRAITGSLPLSLAASNAGLKEIILPLQNAKEASINQQITTRPIKSLKEGVELLNAPEDYPCFKYDINKLFENSSGYLFDFSEVKGQYFAKRAIEVAISGGHNILMIGPPGSGKTMLSQRIPTIMPELSINEAIEITKIHSIAGLLQEGQGIIARRPFRNPHHTISGAAFIGGGSIPRPGEITLSHQGVLFLDELPEFRRDCLEALRQPLEDKTIRIGRIIKTLSFPADFILVCAMNPCLCGNLGNPDKLCRCNPNKVHNYMAKISGPLLDRIDIQIELPPVRYKELSDKTQAEGSWEIKTRVEKCRSRQRERFRDEKISSNSRMNNKLIKKYCILERGAEELLRQALTELGFSARGYDKILKISRTIADMAESDTIKTEHIAEAIQYRCIDR